MLGRIVREQRKARGLTQRALAARVGTSPNYLSALENGEQVGEPAVLQALADALGVPLPNLLHATGMGTTPPVEEPAGIRLDDWVKEMMALGPVLGPAQRLTVLEYARALAHR
jgi:transcriptional regulator with XRE-family HTH domain